MVKIGKISIEIEVTKNLTRQGSSIRVVEAGLTFSIIKSQVTVFIKERTYNKSME